MSKRFLTFLILSLTTVLLITFAKDTVAQEKYLAKENNFSYNFSAPKDEEKRIYSKEEIEEIYADKLADFDLKLHPGSKFTKESNYSLRSLNHCKALFFKAASSVPFDHVSYIKNLTLYFGEGRRGMAGGNTMILKCPDTDKFTDPAILQALDAEFVSVFTHELAHVVDTGKNQGRPIAGESEFTDHLTAIYNDDPSLTFYRFSFEKENKLKSGISEKNFTSTYGMSDPFEDFAESYTYYILHGDEFRELAKTNEILQQKYYYLKIRIFRGKEYYNGDVRNVIFTKRHFDATILPYDLERFLVI